MLINVVPLEDSRELLMPELVVDVLLSEHEVRVFGGTAVG